MRALGVHQVLEIPGAGRDLGRDRRGYDTERLVHRSMNPRAAGIDYARVNAIPRERVSHPGALRYFPSREKGPLRT